MGEMDYYSVLGVDEKEQLARAQQDTSPASEREDRGRKDQEVAAPEVDQDASTAADKAQASAADEADKADDKTKKQTSSENAKYQAARKAAEAEAKRIKVEAAEAIAAERAKAKEQIAKFYSDRAQELKDANLARQLSDRGLDPKAIAQVVEQERVQAQKEAATIRSKAQAEAKRIRNEAQFRAKADSEIAEIHKLDSSISGIKDILNQPYAKEFVDKINKGYSFVDAYKSINMEDIVSREISAAQQAAMAKSAAKQHLNPAADRGGRNDLPIPPAVKAKFKELMPRATNAEIQKYWNKDKSRKK